MVVYDYITVEINDKIYENYLDEEGNTCEFLQGVALTEGHYCKHYSFAGDWSNKADLGSDGLTAKQHYCHFYDRFMGWACCCGTNADCFEKGKSANVKRIAAAIKRRRIKEGNIVKK